MVWWKGCGPCEEHGSINELVVWWKGCGSCEKHGSINKLVVCGGDVGHVKSMVQ